MGAVIENVPTVAAAFKRLHEIATMDGTGDTKTIWDADSPEEVDNAKVTFDRLVGKGYSIFNVKKDGSAGVRMTKFDSSAEKMIAVKPIVGG